MELLNKKVTAIGFETIETDDSLLPALKTNEYSGRKNECNFRC